MVSVKFLITKYSISKQEDYRNLTPNHFKQNVTFSERKLLKLSLKKFRKVIELENLIEQRHDYKMISTKCQIERLFFWYVH